MAAQESFLFTRRSCVCGVCFGAFGVCVAAEPQNLVDPSAALKVINIHRVRYGLHELAIDERLNRTAAQHAMYMSIAKIMSHNIKPWGNLTQRLNASGYVFTYAGENIAVGFRTFEEVFAGWSLSKSHDMCMRSQKATVMGIGGIYDQDTQYKGLKHKTFWCLQLARPL